ncbi:MAG: phosphopantetheinyl transferase [Rhodobacter sp.]|nr:phosphopantetheinyl transferase [Rhodobacter sp.]
MGVTAIFRQGAVEAALASLFPHGVAVAAEVVGAVEDGGLWPEELAGIAGAVTARRAEFAAGRIAARRCLEVLGQRPAGLPIGADRAAVWPTGVFGSISHGGGVAVAVASDVGPVGVDIEEDAALDAELWPIICGKAELSELPEGDRGRWVRQIFAAKEALFKAQAPARRAMFGFDAVDLRLKPDGFVARVRMAVGDFSEGQDVHGRLALVQGLILAGVAR